MGVKLTIKQKVIRRRNKINVLLNKIIDRSYDEQLIINNDIIKTIKKHLRLKIKIRDNKTILDKDIYEKIFDDICSLGKPFLRHKKGNTITYHKSIYYIKINYKRYRGNILDIFKLGQEYFLSPYFIYKPENGKISIPDFFKYNQNRLQYAPHLHKYPKSWFTEFSKGREYIEDHYLKKPKEYNNELTNIFIDIWQNYKNSKISSFDKKYAIMFVNEAINIAKLNSLSTRTIFDVVKDELYNNLNIENTKYLISDFFINDVIPKGLVKKGIFKNIREVRK